MTVSIPGIEDVQLEEYQREKLGHDMRRLFLFRGNFRNLNHGSFGTHPRSVQRYQQQLQELAEVSPDAFHRYTVPRMLDQSRLALSHVFEAPARDIVIVPNVTTAMNIVLQNLKYEQGDGILYFAGAYGAVEKSVFSTCETTPAVPVKVPLVHPISDDEVLSRFEAAIEKYQASGSGNRVKVAIFDTITSMPAYRMPFERLTAACKRLGVLSLIDGAHGAGHFRLSLAKFDPDFFTSNMHKWLFVPRGSAIFYVPQRNQHLIRTSFPTSHNFVPTSEFGSGALSPLPVVEGTGVPSTPFSRLFQFVGTLDVTPYLTVAESLRFRLEVCGGEQAIMEYNWNLAEKAGSLMAQRLGTVVLNDQEKSLTKECAMRNVELPLDPDAVLRDIDPNDAAARRSAAKVVCDWLGEQMLLNDETFLPVLWYGDKWWTRISAQIYLNEKDFEFAAGVLEILCKRVQEGELAPKLKPKARL